MDKDFKMVATTLFGLESVLAKELKDLGAQDVKEAVRSVSFRGDKGFLYKANINIRGKDYKTPLHHAAFRWNDSQSEKIIQLLIDHGANLNVWDNKMNTPYNTLLKSYRYDWERDDKLQMPFHLLNMLNPANDYNRE